MTSNINNSYCLSRLTDYQRVGFSDFEDSIEEQSEIKTNESNIAVNKLTHLSNQLIENKPQTEDKGKFFDLEIKYNEHKRQEQLAKELEEELEEIEFQTECKESKKKFDILKIKHHNLFNYTGIKPADDEKSYPSSLKVDQDRLIIAPATIPLYTRCLSECIAVVVSGTGINGSFHALLHFSGALDPEKVLTKIVTKLKEKGCESDSIKVCLVGGKLPHIDRTEYHNETCIEDYCFGSIDSESDFLSLSKKFNIVGVQFNLAEGNETLAVRVSQDEIVWTKKDFDFEEESIDEKDSDLVEHCTNPEEISLSEEISSNEETSDHQRSESSESSSFDEFSDDSSLIKKEIPLSRKRKNDDKEVINYFPKKIKNGEKESITDSPIIQKLLDVCNIHVDFPRKKLREDDESSTNSQGYFNTLNLQRRAFFHR